MPKHVATLNNSEVFICVNNTAIPFYPTVISTMLDITCRNAIHSKSHVVTDHFASFFIQYFQ